MTLTPMSQYRTHVSPAILPPKPEPKSLHPVRTLAEDAAICNRRMRAVANPHSADTTKRASPNPRATVVARVVHALQDGDTADDISDRLNITRSRAIEYLRVAKLQGLVTRFRKNNQHPYVYTRSEVQP